MRRNRGEGKCKQINGVTYWTASSCLKFLGTDYNGVRRMAKKFAWRKYQLPTSPFTYYAAEDVKKVYSLSQSVESFDDTRSSEA